MALHLGLAPSENVFLLLIERLLSSWPSSFNLIHMDALEQIEASIQTLPAQDFFALAGWMTEKYLQVLTETDFEPPRTGD